MINKYIGYVLFDSDQSLKQGTKQQGLLRRGFTFERKAILIQKGIQKTLQRSGDQDICRNNIPGQHITSSKAGAA